MIIVRANTVYIDTLLEVNYIWEEKEIGLDGIVLKKQDYLEYVTISGMGPITYLKSKIDEFFGDGASERFENAATYYVEDIDRISIEIIVEDFQNLIEK